jgi:hypothetical protein
MTEIIPPARKSTPDILEKSATDPHQTTCQEERLDDVISLLATNSVLPSSQSQKPSYDPQRKIHTGYVIFIAFQAKRRPNDSFLTILILS